MPCPHVTEGQYRIREDSVLREFVCKLVAYFRFGDTFFIPFFRNTSLEIENEGGTTVRDRP